MTYKFLVLELIERETVACTGKVVVLLQVGNNTWRNHKLYIAAGNGSGVVLILRLELHLYQVSLRDDVSAQIEVNCGNESCRNHIRAQQSLEAYTCCKHSDNLGVARKIRRKEDYGDKHEQRRE